MIISDLDDERHPALESDVLIIGAGAVGLALGLTLARTGVNVTILEAGGLIPPPDFERANAGPSTGRAHTGIHSGRMKALGGTTRLWGGQLAPLDWLDLKARTFDGKPSWPVAYEEFTHFIDKAYEFLGISESGQDAGTVMGSVRHAIPDFGADLRFRLNVWLPKPDFIHMFGNEIRESQSLKVFVQTEAMRFNFSSDGSRVSAVEARSADGRIARFHGQVVVLANGTLEISRLLLRTAVLQHNCGFSKNENIGKWYIDHLHGDAASIYVTNSSRVNQIFNHIYFSGRKYSVKILAAGNFLEKRQIANCAGFVNPRLSFGRTLSELLGLMRRMAQSGGARSLLAAWLQFVGMARILVPIVWRYLVKRRSSFIFSKGVDLSIEIEQIPTSKSYIFLDPNEPAETAAVGLHWELDGREIDAVADYCDAFKTWFEGQKLGTVEIDPRVIRRDPAFLDDCHDASHQLGGARMAMSQEHGVVDPNLKVFGTDNLYVLGAAVFPSGGFANPTLSAIALALRLAHQLAPLSAPAQC